MSSATTGTTPGLHRLDAVRFALGQVWVIATLVACGVLGLATPLVLVVVYGVTARCCERLPVPYALALGAAAWAYLTGFTINRYGELTLTPPDLVRLALLLTCAAAAHWRR